MNVVVVSADWRETLLLVYSTYIPLQVRTSTVNCRHRHIQGESSCGIGTRLKVGVGNVEINVVATENLNVIHRSFVLQGQSSAYAGSMGTCDQ